MPHISSKKLDEKLLEKLFRKLIVVFEQAQNKRYMTEVTKELFTETEKIMLAKRMAIAILFSKGYDHRTISSMLKVSTTTVNSIARYLNAKTPGYQLLIKKYSQKQSTKEFIQELERYFYRLQPGQHFVDEGLIKAKLGHKKKLF